ncbi:pfp, partial [Symbiodinium necroappetens]
MGRQAHHISDSQKETLTQTVNNLCEVVQSRRRSGRYSGVVLISRQLIETLPEMDQLKAEIAAIVKAEAADKNRQPFPTEVDSRLKSDATKALFKRLPRFVQMSMIRNRDSSGLPVLPKDLEAERILGRFVQQELRNQPPVKKVKATFAPRFHAMDLMTSSPLPSAFDCAFGYALGHTAALLVNERRNFYVACCAGMHRNTRYWEPCAIPFTYLYPEDVPSGSLVEEWVDCEHGTSRGFIKSKNLPSVASATSGDWLEVRDSFAGNDETCMRRHCEQDASAGNVVCFVPNGPKIVKMVDRWTECRWRGYKLFAKARHVQPAPAGASLDTVGHGGDLGKPGARAKAAPGAEEVEPPAKRLKKGRPPCKYGAGCYQKNPLHRAKFSHPGDADFVPDASGEPSASSSAGTPSTSAGDKTGSVDSAPADVTMKEGSAADAELPSSAAEPAVSALAAAPAGLAAGDVSAPTVPEAKAPPEELHAPPAIPDALPSKHSEAPAGAKESRDCDCCFDNVPATDGVSCPGKAHFFCGPCLANFLEAFKTSEYAEQKKAKGRALCPMKDSDTPFGDGVLAAFVPQDVFDEYLQIRIKVAEQSIQEQFEKENTAKIEELKEKLAKATGSGEQLELDKHRLKIIDDIFTLKCPRCKMAFLDYDNCAWADLCETMKPTRDCGKDAHSHFYKNGSKCPNEGGPLFVPHNVWQGYQNARKERLLCEYLAGLPDEMRKKVADLVAPDAKDLGIEMPQDLSAAGLMPEAHGIQRLKVTIPRRMRGLIHPVKKELPSKVDLASDKSQ